MASRDGDTFCLLDEKNEAVAYPVPTRTGYRFLGWRTDYGEELSCDNLREGVTLVAKWEAQSQPAAYSCSITYTGTWISQTATSISVRGGWTSKATCTVRTTVNTAGWNYITVSASQSSSGSGGFVSVVGNQPLISAGGNKYYLNGATSVTITAYGVAYEGDDGYDGPYYASAEIGSVVLSKN